MFPRALLSVQPLVSDLSWSSVKFCEVVTSVKENNLPGSWTTEDGEFIPTWPPRKKMCRRLLVFIDERYQTSFVAVPAAVQDSNRLLATGKPGGRVGEDICTSK